MTHAWDANHPERLELGAVDAGDVVICGAFSDGAPMLAGIDRERVAFVAPLDSRSDLEWLLRALHLHPRVRHVILAGDDRWLVGEALIALWNEGLDDAGAIAGGRGPVAPEIEAEAIEQLRRQVEVRDWRRRGVTALATGIDELPLGASERSARELPDPEIPKRKVFLSRKTSFPLYANDVGDSWLQLLNLCLRIGTERQTSGSERLAEALNVVVTVGLPVIAEDLEVEVAPPEAFPSCFEVTADDFERYYRGLDGFGTVGFIGDRVERSAEGRSATLVLQQAGDLDCSAIAPDAITASFDVVDGTLYGSFVLRSVDVHNAWPLEALALIRMHHDVARRLSLEPGATTFVLHGARLHGRDWQRAERVLAEHFRRPLPLQVDHSGVFLFGNDKGKARAMLLDHGASTIFWEDAFDSPNDLSWYIVDAMPWLLPQHMRYVGQECATLLRAMQEGECYLQG